MSLKKTYIDSLSFYVIIAFGDDMKEITVLKDDKFNVVVKANELIQQSKFNLSTKQQKIVLYLISKIKPNDDEFKLYKIKIKDFCEMCGIKNLGGKDYQELREQIKTISDKSLWIRLDNGKDTLLRWIEKPYIDEKSGTVEIKLDRDMKPFLLQLKENFTQYELIYTLRFKSKYSIRLYEYLQSIHYDKLNEYTKTIPLDDLKQLLNAEKYTAFCDFNSRVLKFAIKEINELSDKIVSIEQIKEGKKVLALKFTISNKEPYETYLLNQKIER